MSAGSLGLDACARYVGFNSVQVAPRKAANGSRDIVLVRGRVKDHGTTYVAASLRRCASYCDVGMLGRGKSCHSASAEPASTDGLGLRGIGADLTGGSSINVLEGAFLEHAKLQILE